MLSWELSMGCLLINPKTYYLLNAFISSRWRPLTNYVDWLFLIFCSALLSFIKDNDYFFYFSTDLLDFYILGNINDFLLFKLFLFWDASRKLWDFKTNYNCLIKCSGILSINAYDNEITLNLLEITLYIYCSLFFKLFL